MLDLTVESNEMQKVHYKQLVLFDLIWIYGGRI